jgi:hypothetical protein
VPFSLQLVEFTDREFLFVVDDALDADGWATSSQVQDVLQLDHPRATQCIGSRMAKLRALDVIDYDHAAPRNARSRWTITAKGRLFMDGKLSAAQQKAMDALRQDAGHTLMALRALREEFETADDMTAGMMRREWTHGVQRRKLRG